MRVVITEKKSERALSIKPVFKCTITLTLSRAFTNNLHITD